MPIAYDVTTNVITITGYTEGSPCGFIDLWNADKAGTLSLHARTGISSTDASPVNLTRNARPTDRAVLGGAKHDLYIVVTAWTNMTSATVRLIGTDTNDAAQTEDIAVNANGTYYATKYFKTLTQSQVVAFAKSDSGSFAYEVRQGQWGIVWKNGNQYAFDARIQVGDGSTTTYFGDDSKQIIFNNGILTVANDYFVFIKNSATFRSGILDDATQKVTSRGCSFLTLDANYHSFAIRGEAVNPTGILLFYSSQLASTTSKVAVIRYFTESSKIYNSILTFRVGLQTYIGEVFNVVLSYGKSGSQIGLSQVYSTTVDRCFIYNFQWALGLWNISSSIIRTFKSIFGRLNTYTAQCGSDFKGIVNLVIPDFETYAFDWYSGADGKIYRQYEFDLKATDKDNNPINGAMVILQDKDGNQIFNVTTDANGIIPTQIVSRGYYDLIHGNALQDYGPHALTIKKNGYQTYFKKFVLATKTGWEIKLAKAVIVLTNLGQPIVNLRASDPENPVLLAL